MKLLYQINLAFGLLLVLVLGATAGLIHYVLMDHFITAQKQELRTIGATVASTLTQQAGSVYDLSAAPVVPVATVAVPSGVQAYIVDGQGHVVENTAPVRLTAGSAVTTLPAAGTPAADNEAKPTAAIQAVALAQDSGRYIVSQSIVPQGTLTLVTPISKVKAVERALFGRLLVVLAVGAALVLGLSLLLTRKLIRPLMKLREELGKVKRRQFADVALVKASGEIGVVARTVYELAGELDRYNRVQKQFIQNASHELKTPLMSIAGYAEGIRDGVFEGAGSRRGLDIIIGECGRLNKIVTEMTLLAKLDSEEDGYRPSVVPVEELVTETVERINPLLANRGLSMTTNIAEGAGKRLAVRADRDKLLQALLNVVSNAARYADSRIAIEVGVEDDRIVIAVSDDGRGFPESLLPHLFHRFVKGKDGENGLGLAISRAIVERCGGFIRAANREDGGAVVSMKLPGASAA